VTADRLRRLLLAAATAPFVLAWIGLAATRCQRSSESERPRKPPGTI
jgi:hypothetical protein